MTQTEYALNGRMYRVLFPDAVPPPTADEYRDLLVSVKAHGRVLVPVVIDEHDGIIDGINRCRAATELGFFEVPIEVVTGLTHAEKLALAVELNDCRRQQSGPGIEGRRQGRLEKRAAILAAAIENPGLSDRAVADKVKEKTGKKPSPTTVGDVRRQLSRSGETGQLPRTTGKDGKSRPARRVKPSPAGGRPGSGSDPESHQARAAAPPMSDSPRPDGTLGLTKGRRYCAWLDVQVVPHAADPEFVYVSLAHGLEQEITRRPIRMTCLKDFLESHLRDAGIDPAALAHLKFVEVPGDPAPRNPWLDVTWGPDGKAVETWRTHPD